MRALNCLINHRCAWVLEPVYKTWPAQLSLGQTAPVPFCSSSIVGTKPICFNFKAHLFLFQSRKKFAMIIPLAYSAAQKSESSKNELDSGLLLSSVGTVQLLLWSLDIYSPEGWPRGLLLEYSSNAAQCTSCHQKHCIELPQSAWQDLGVTVSPPSLLPIGLHHMPPIVTAQAEGMSRIWCDVFSHACLLACSEFSSSDGLTLVNTN